MDKLVVSDKIKKSIETEFKNVLRLLNYNNMAPDIFRRFYIDGRLFYHILIDREQPTMGIKELRYIDPRKIRKVREVKKEKDPRTGVEMITLTNEYLYYFNLLIPCVDDILKEINRSTIVYTYKDNIWTPSYNSIPLSEDVT